MIVMAVMLIKERSAEGHSRVMIMLKMRMVKRMTNLV